MQGTYGYLTIDSAGHYTYTLTTPEGNVPAGDNGTNIQSGTDAFTYTVQDAFGNTNTSTITHLHQGRRCRRDTARPTRTRRSRARR
ncbi:Ig-like domain-containing protein [Mesorhizobium atlanticum]